MVDVLRLYVKSYRKMKFNDFFESCGLSVISEVDMDLSFVLERIRRRYIVEIREVVVVVFRTLLSSYVADLWEVLRILDKMREVFDFFKFEYDEKKVFDGRNEKYIRVFAEIYDNVFSRNIKR